MITFLRPEFPTCQCHSTHDRVCKTLFCFVAGIMVLSILPGQSVSVGLADLPGVPSTFAPDERPGFHVMTVFADYRMDGYGWSFYRFTYNESFHRMFAEHDGMMAVLFRDCSGPNGTMRVVENMGPHQLLTFQYHGQTIVPIAGWHQWSGWRNIIISESWGGSENLTMDWKAGIWNMTNGIVVYHQAEQVLGQVELSVLYVIPTPPTPTTPTVTADGGGRKCKG